jgi:hypothetical protein
MARPRLAALGCVLPLAETLRMAAIGSLVVSPRSSRGFRIKPLEELNPLFNQAALDPIQSPAQHVGFDALCDLNFPALLQVDPLALSPSLNLRHDGGIFGCNIRELLI